MKVLLINGSPHAKGCTYTVLREVAGELEKENIETEFFHVGIQPIRGCTGCYSCRKPATAGRCIYSDDPVNFLAEKAAAADGIVIGSPVHYAGASGAVTSLLDRMFFSHAGAFRFKPGAVVASCRRAGSTTALDQLQKYLTISEMPVVSSTYWNMVHGMTPEDLAKDGEGMRTMRNLGRNMAWMLKCIEAGKAAGLGLPERE